MLESPPFARWIINAFTSTFLVSICGNSFNIVSIMIFSVQRTTQKYRNVPKKRGRQIFQTIMLISLVKTSDLMVHIFYLYCYMEIFRKLFFVDTIWCFRLSYNMHPYRMSIQNTLGLNRNAFDNLSGSLPLPQIAMIPFGLNRADRPNNLKFINNFMIDKST